jgi:pyruvate,water dikinase
MGAMFNSAHDKLIGELSRGDGKNLHTHPELQSAVAAYLDKFSDRCAQELKLESITLSRDPTPLYRAIAAARGAVEPPQTDATDVLSKLFHRKPVRRLVARPILAWAKARVRDRENLRFERTRIFGRARHVLRAMGNQMVALNLLDDVEDIFQLTIQEVLGAVEGFGVASDLKSLVALRKSEMDAASAKPDPAERLEVHGAVLANVQNLVSADAPIDDATHERAGTGCSAGIVRATARVINDPRKQAIDKGDILVARHTDPGWIAVFTNASAIVVERGSLLSHSAIVARELGIPCVVGMKGAMSWIKDGETIEVDGATGVVRRVI